MSVVIVFPSLFTEGQALADIIKKAAVGITNVNVEYNCIICEARDVVKLASELAGMSGIDRVAIANKVSTNFSEVTSAIVEVGSKVMIPGDRFYVKVILLRPAVAAGDYVGRDIEFAASGTLAARLASIKALPAKTESTASRLILAILAKESAYICIQVITAPGGSVVGSRGKALSSIHSPLSFLSCLTAAKAGLDCSTILLPYVNKNDLVNNARLVQLFATKTRRNRQKILAMPINVPAKGIVSSLLKEKIISKILVECQNNRIVFPLTVAIHPIWFLEPIIKETVLAGKMPFAPLLFLSSELDKYAKEAKIELNGSAVKVAKSMFEKYNDRIDSEVRKALKRKKKLELKIGPNYLHDIIDSI